MSESMFGDFADDIADAPDDPFGLSDGTYHGAIIGASKKEGTKKDSDVKWAGLEVELSAEGQENTHTHFMSYPMETDAENVRALKLSSLKKFLQGCGIPRERMNSVTPDDLIDLEVVYTIRTSKKGFKNLDIQLAKGAAIARSASADDDFDFSDL